MSDPRLAYVPRVTPELRQQFEPLGGEFYLRSVTRILSQEALLPPARATINSFINNPETRQAVADLYRGVDSFAPMWQPDSHTAEETVSYRPTIPEGHEEHTEVAILISPNALKVVSGPIAAVAERLPRDPHRDPFGPAEYLATSYRALYAAALTRYLVMSQVMTQYDISSSALSAIDPLLVNKTQFLYQRYFGKDEVEDTAVQLQRLGLALGGAVMLRAMANNIHDEVTSGIQPSTTAIGHQIKMYAIGIRSQNPSDQKEASFALSHALHPQEAARVFQYWFS